MTIDEFAKLGLKEFDDIVISGTTSTPSGLVVGKMEAVIATVRANALKVWPTHEDGKLWFMVEDITFLEVIPEPQE